MNFLTKLADVSSYVMVLDTSLHILQGCIFSDTKHTAADM